jgi:hypothetical protein
MNQGRTILLSVILSVLPGLGGCGKTQQDFPEARDGFPKGKSAQPDPKGKSALLPVKTTARPKTKPFPAKKGPIKMDQAMKTIKRLGGFVEMNLRGGDLVVTGVHLSGSQATDADLGCLHAFPLLENLGLADTAITDAGLVHLKSLAHLRHINLEGTKVTDKGAAELRLALVNVKIDRERGAAAGKTEPPFSIANNWADHPELRRDIPWETAAKMEKDIMFRAIVGGAKWAIRMNDFPDEPLYTLLIEGKAIIHFDDWPKFWKRPEFPK